MSHNANGQPPQAKVQSSKTFEISDVLNEELGEIVARRRAAGLDVPVGEDLARELVKESLVGLALSGGGIRSASFNLGVIQALYRWGLFRYIDYLSTVSGGGYIGSHLSSLLSQPDVGCGQDHFPLNAKETGEQPDRVLHLTRGGNYLHRPVRFADHYLFGLLLNNLAIFSGAFLICALVALAWRGLDLPIARDVLHELSPRLANDLVAPFLPSLLFAALWLMAWAWSYLRRGPRASAGLSPKLFGTFLVFAAIGLAVVLGNGDIGLGDLGTLFGSNTWVVYEAARVIFVLLILLALLPFFAPGRLIRSGVRPRGPGEKYIFRMASTALLFGIPLIAIHLLAKENLSGVATERTELVSADVTDWQLLLKGIAEPESRDELSPLYKALNEKLRARADIAPALDPDKAQELWLAVEHPDTRRDPEIRVLKDRMIEALDEDVLSDKSLISALPISEVRSQAGSRLTPEDQIALAKLLDRRELKVPPVTPEETRTQNLLLLSSMIPELTVDRNQVLRVVVIEADQKVRLWIVGGAALAFLVFGALIDINATSLHGFYRAQLAKAYVEPLSQSEPDIPLTQLKNTEKGAPYHLLTGAQNLFGTHTDASTPFCSFLFSKRFIGSRVAGFVRTEEYLDGEVDLATAMAVSGAAVSPMRSTNRLVALIMTIFNVRLGHWFPSPAYWENRARPTVFRLIANWVRSPKTQKLCFVTDGGHNENLGLGQLLRRECVLIILSDSGCDPKHEFADFVKLYWRSRLRGIRFYGLDGAQVADIAPLKLRAEQNLCADHTLRFVIHYPSGRKGLLVYLKPSFDGDEELDLLAYRAAHPDFPHDPTTDQFYAEETFEAYRRLGEHIGERLLAHPELGEELWRQNIDTQELMAMLGKSASKGINEEPAYVAKG